MPPFLYFQIPKELFVDLEFGAASSKEVADLVGSSDTGVNVSLFGLSTHLFGSGEVAAFESLELCVCLGHNVADVLEVGALGHQFEQFGLVDDFLTGTVDEDTTLGHHVDELVVDAALGLSGSGDVEGDNVAGLEEVGLAGNGGGHAGGVDLLSGEECVVSIDFHTEALSDAGDVAAYVTESEKTELLAHEFGTGLAVVEVTDAEDEETHDELGDGVAVLTRGVHGDDTLCGASFEVEVVIASASADDNLEVLGVINNFLGNFVGADDKSVSVSDCGVEIIHVGIFFEKSQCVAVLLNDFADAINGNFCERFFCSN